MIQNVQTTELALITNVWIHVLCMIHVVKMLNVKQEVTDLFADALKDGLEIHMLNAIHVGFHCYLTFGGKYLNGILFHR